MEIEKKIRFAVVGAGFVGKRHAQIVQRHAEAELVAIADVRTAAECGVADWAVPFYSSIESMLLQQKNIDVICVCTPNGLHARHSLLALEAGAHVVCEKPMALTKNDCEQVLYKSLQVGRQVFCVMQNRYSPPSIWLKETIENQLLGDIFLVQINCYWNRDDRYYFPNGKAHEWKGSTELDGGTLFTQFSHFVDILYWVFGDIKNVQARFANYNHNHSIQFEDSGFVQFDFVRGGLGCINYSTSVYDKNLESSLTVIGSKGSLKIGGQYMNEIECCHIENYTMPQLAPTNPANNYGNYQGSAANHSYLIENVIDVLKGRKTITTNALEGLKVVEIIEKIYELKK